ncbi:hypothetical protein [Ruania alba]|nr:hypothetical protein [Ruania alba]
MRGLTAEKGCRAVAGEQLSAALPPYRGDAVRLLTALVAVRSAPF